MKIRNHLTFATAQASGSGGTIAPRALATAPADATGTTTLGGVGTPTDPGDAGTWAVSPRVIPRRVLRGPQSVDTGF